MGNRHAVTKDRIEEADPISKDFVFDSQVQFELNYLHGSITQQDFDFVRVGDADRSHNLKGEGELKHVGAYVKIGNEKTDCEYLLRSKFFSVRTIYRINKCSSTEKSHMVTIKGNYWNFPNLRFKVYKGEELVYTSKVGYPPCNITIRDKQKRVVAYAQCNADHSQYKMNFASGVDVLLCLFVFASITLQIRKFWRMGKSNIHHRINSL